MINAKEELLLELERLGAVKCAWIGGEDFDEELGSQFVKLKVGHSKEDFESFLNILDFEYDSGYGGQNLFGQVWFEDGSWLERGEYDGSEWWNHKTTPIIPEKLTK